MLATFHTRVKITFLAHGWGLARRAMDGSAGVLENCQNRMFCELAFTRRYHGCATYRGIDDPLTHTSGHQEDFQAESRVVDPIRISCTASLSCGPAKAQTCCLA